MIFVGGDQMTTEMSVPLSRDAPVEPGEEVDVAVSEEEPGRSHAKEGGETTSKPPTAPAPAPPAPPTTPADEADLTAEAADEPIVPAIIISNVSAISDMSDAAERSSDDGVLISEADAAPEEAGAALPTPGAALPAPGTSGPEAGTSTATACLVEGAMSPEAKVGMELQAMGFTDAPLVEAALSKHGPDLEACARDLANVSEWTPLLDDLHEMGFVNIELNKMLMLKHNGSVKRTVRELVEEA